MSQEIKKQIESAIQDLYANEQYKLRQICNKEMLKFGGLSQKDYDGFYSRAGQEIAIAKKHQIYNPSKGKTPLEFFTGVIKRSVWKEMTDRNRGKRQVIIEIEEEDENGNIEKRKEYIPTISIDAPIGDEEGITIEDMLQSDFNIDDELLKVESEKEYSPEMEEYLCKLSKLQVKVLELMADEYTPEEIRNILHIDNTLYNDSVRAIRSYKNTKCIASLIGRKA